MVSTNVAELLKQLTLEEKVSLLSGADIWQSHEISRLGIGSIKTTDGPAGARGKQLVDGLPAAFVPAAVCQAATWSKSDLRGLGRLLCRETKTKASQVLLAPTICCARNPLGGRNFECFGEDPFLSGSLAVEYVGGLQETGEVSATPKHFVANEQEYKRISIDAVISETVLREIYLRPFEMVIKSASPPGCIMTSYNLVNGHHMDANARILKDILRGEWGFQGLVMSDWGGTTSTIDSAVAGLDLEMPGPPEHRGEQLLRAAKESLEVLAAVDASVTNLLTLLRTHDLLGLAPEQARQTRVREERSETAQDDIALMRKIAADGIVLLKNSEKTLPLDAKALSGKQVAFIGPNALHGTPGGGGSASMNPQYLSEPLDSFKAVAESQGANVAVKYALGAYARKWLPVTSKKHFKLPETSDGAAGSNAMLRMDFFESQDMSGPIKETQYRTNSYIDLTDTCPDDFQADPVPVFSFRITAIVTPTSTGEHSFSLYSVGASRLYVDGELVVDNTRWVGLSDTFFAFGSAEVRGTKHMNAGRQYNVVVEGWKRTDKEYFDMLPDDVNIHFAAYPSVRLGYEEQLPSADELVSEAVALADESDHTVVVLGLDDEWESEGYDRQFMALPGDQDRLVEALMQQTKRPERVIFVNQSGSPVEFPWIDKVSTLLQAWYGGQEAGNGLADVLLGLVNPSGRLPITWPVRYSDLPFESDPESWPGKGNTVNYNEGDQVGYRWYSRNSAEPLWWFGYGESYTSFNRVLGKVTGDEDRWALPVEVQNSGPLAGKEVVQVYLWPKGQPELRQLAAFEKTVVIEPKGTTLVEVVISKRDVARWVDGKWELRAGDYVLGVGTSVGDATTATVEVAQNKAKWWSP